MKEKFRCIISLLVSGRVQGDVFVVGFRGGWLFLSSYNWNTRLKRLNLHCFLMFFVVFFCFLVMFKALHPYLVLFWFQLLMFITFYFLLSLWICSVNVMCCVFSKDLVKHTHFKVNMFLFVFFAMFFQSSNQQNYKVPLDTYFGQYTHLVVYTRSTSYEQTTPVGEIRSVEGEERKGQSDETYLIVVRYTFINFHHHCSYFG